MVQEQGPKVLPIVAGVDFDFIYPAGMYMSKCLHELKENARFLAIECPKCKTIWLPPQVVCSACHAETGENWVELGPKGSVVNWVLMHMPTVDLETKELITSHRPAAIVYLDGPDGRGANFLHYLEETDMDKITKGMRVKAVFKPKEERKGHPKDVEFFRTVED